MHVEFAGMTSDNTKSIRTHSHSQWEILYYLSGEGVLTIGKEQFLFKPGDIICQPPNILHSEQSENGFYNIYIQVSDFLCPAADGIISFRDTGNQDIKNIIMFLYREFHLKNNGWTQLVNELFNVFYLYMMSQNLNANENKYVKKFKEILVSNISNSKFRIEIAQKNIPLSSYYFKRLFKKETGETPLEYLTTKRIEYAKKLIETISETSITIKEIAYLAGYDDQYYFSRIFKKNTGMCPTEWINSLNLRKH